MSEGPVIITRNGKAAAVLLAPKDNDELERLMLARLRRFQSSSRPLRFAREEPINRSIKSVSPDGFKTQLGLI